jgi:outer membrane protein assembly factor BamA
MMRTKTYCLWLFFLCFTKAQYAYAQPLPNLPVPADTVAVNTNYIVGAITLVGNKKTKASIILREVPFKTGDTYLMAILLQKFEDGRKQLMNTALFNSVLVAAKNFTGDTVNIEIIVKERWYLYPVPYFKPVDRNLNQWIVEQKGSLARVNYGAKLLYYNSTGHNDKLKMFLITGYTKQLSFGYDRLYIDKKMKWGMRLNYTTGNGREVFYNTINDKQVFLKDENKFLRYFTNASMELTYRRAIRARHSFGFTWQYERVSDTALRLNPGYFKTGNSLGAPGFFYNLSYADLDFNPYPTKGYAANISFVKQGFNKNFNLWLLDAKFFASRELFKKTYLSMSAYGSIKLPFNQPYIGKRFLGFGDTFMQGYEYYIVDGVAGGYLKTTLTREFLNFKVRIPNIKKGKPAEYIPVRIFGKVFGNTGYVHNPQPGDNFLSNKMLYSGGLGIDILTFYDVTFKLEWSFNQLGENGLFLHRKSIF